MKEYLISQEEADAMMNNFPKTIYIPETTNVDMLTVLQKENPDAKIVPICCVYRIEDEDRYGRTRNPLEPLDSEANKVENYRTTIFQLIKIVSGAIEVTYYDFASLCPPPYPDCSREVYKSDNV